MSRTVRRMLVAGAVLLVLPLSVAPAADEEMVDNPLYKYWASFKPQSRAVHVETTVLSDADKGLAPDGKDVKIITYTLQRVGPRGATVQTNVVERSFLRVIQSAPSRITFPPKVKKAHIEAVLFKVGAKTGEETLEVGDKSLKCKTLSGSLKSGGEETDYKIWLSEEVPGGIVKEVRTTKQDGKVVAETTTMLRNFRKAE
jgi:hypothetical protein